MYVPDIDVFKSPEILINEDISPSSTSVAITPGSSNKLSISIFIVDEPTKLIFGDSFFFGIKNAAILISDSILIFIVSVSNPLDHSEKTYYLPLKNEWGMPPSENETWTDFNNIKKLVNKSILIKKAPLCWQKYKDSFAMFFIVWW